MGASERAMKQNLDFIIIGAQKSGTTTLFKWLEGHPEIFLPSAKEVPLLTDEWYSKGLEQNMKTFFQEASEDKLWGKAPPHYLADSKVPTRCKEHYPEVKLIVILRHPIKSLLCMVGYIQQQ